MSSTYDPTRYAGAKEYYKLPEGDPENAIWNRPLEETLSPIVLNGLRFSLTSRFNEAPTPLFLHPEVGDYYWTATLNPEKPAVRCKWQGRRIDKLRLLYGNIYRSEDEAIVAHINAMIGFKAIQLDRARVED